LTGENTAGLFFAAAGRFHHNRMDGTEAGRFLETLQKEMNRLR